MNSYPLSFFFLFGSFLSREKTSKSPFFQFPGGFGQSIAISQHEFRKLHINYEKMRATWLFAYIDGGSMRWQRGRKRKGRGGEEEEKE